MVEDRMAFLIGMLDILMNDDMSLQSDSSDSETDYEMDMVGPPGFGNLRRRPIRAGVGADTDSDAEIQLPPSVFNMRDYYNNPSSSVQSPLLSSKRNAKDSTEEAQLPNNPKVPSLLELTAKIVGKTYTCQMLESTESLLDEALLKKVAFWAFPTSELKVKAYAGLTDHYRSWTRGEALIKENKIREMWQVGFMATAYIAKYTGEDGTSSNDIRVSLTFEQQRILTSTCSECKTDIWCLHVVAAVLYRIQKPHLVCVYAPMTETLSSLNRSQLQKILQYAVYEDPGGVLGKVFKHIDAVRDLGSEMNTAAGIPDPTFGGVELANSHWNMSLDLLEKNIQKSLSSFETSSFHSSLKYYPDSYDITKKKKGPTATLR